MQINNQESNDDKEIDQMDELLNSITHNSSDQYRTQLPIVHNSQRMDYARHYYQQNQLMSSEVNDGGMDDIKLHKKKKYMNRSQSLHYKYQIKQTKFSDAATNSHRIIQLPHSILKGNSMKYSEATKKVSFNFEQKTHHVQHHKK